MAITKIAGGVAFQAALALAVLSGFLLWRIAVLDQASRAEDRADDVLVASSTLRADLLRAETSNPGTAAQSVTADLATLTALVDDPENKAQLSIVKALYADPHRNAESLDVAAQSWAERLLALRERKSDENNRQVRIVIVSAVVGTLIVGLLLVFLIRRQLLVEAEEQRQKAAIEEENVRMREATRIKGEFVAHMSHEFRTPLTAILGFGEMLHDGKAGPVTDVQRGYLSDMLSSGRHLLGLINHVLDLAKAEAGKVPMNYEPCDPRKLVEEVAATMRPLARERDVTMRVDVASSPDRIVTDPSRFKQILYNYLSNAIGFTSPGGIITVSLHSAHNGTYRIEVSDTGIGVAPEDRAHIFEEFAQVADANGRRRDGVGLGLALTKRIVETQGGTVGVDSRLGVGSTFYAELPRDPTSRNDEATPDSTGFRNL